MKSQNIRFKALAYTFLKFVLYIYLKYKKTKIQTQNLVNTLKQNP